MIDETAAPTPKTDVDFSSLSPTPTPEQYFLLSRLDGTLTVGELCQISGLGRAKTIAGIEVLARIGAIDIAGYEPDTAGADPSASAQQSSAASDDAVGSGSAGPPSSSAPEPTDRVVPNYPIPAEQFDFDRDLLDADVPLDQAHRREVLCLHGQLSDMTFYDLFGLDSEASNREVKRAYFRLSKRYHPDKFFRKNMDAYGPMVETLFKEITKAYRTLSNEDKRQEYDQNLRRAEGDPVSTDTSTLHEQSSTEEAASKRSAAAALLMRRAEKLQARGDAAAAAAEYRKALALNRDPQLAVRVAGSLVDDAQMYDEAATFARAALKLGADAAPACFVLGRALRAQGAVESAAEQFRRVLDEVEDHERARKHLQELDEDR